MNIGLLNTKIKIQKAVVIIDDIGNHTNTYVDYYECFATVSSEGQGEANDAGQVVDEGKMNFTIRWCDLASKIDTTNFRVIMGESIYNIIGIDHMNYKKKSIKLKCQRVRR